MNKGNSSIIVLSVIVGLIFMAAMVFLYLRATQEAKGIYSDVIDEAKASKEEAPFGFGAVPDPDLTDNPKDDDQKPPKPIIYMYPVRKR